MMIKDMEVISEFSNKLILIMWNLTIDYENKIWNINWRLFGIYGI
jgi:hypothetical protein